MAKQKNTSASRKASSASGEPKRTGRREAAKAPTTSAPLPTTASEDGELDPVSEDIKDRGDRFPVVGIGGSAGGLEALQEFFAHMPEDSGMAFIVVTHQHPGHTSMLPSLLGHKTRMPVVEAADGTRVEPNCVYIAPPELLAISGSMLCRVPSEESRAPFLPIDYFFRTLAADQREQAICIVLSGTGSDGTQGVRAVKAELGMAMVQEPSSAKYGGMPTSAAGTGLADYILAPAVMGRQLISYIRGPYLKPSAAAPQTTFPREPLQRIVTLLRSRTGHDFGPYKESTIRRRIERRMNVHLIKEPADYVRYLQENPHEIDILFGELLISVTNFFRDPPAFEALEKALSPLLQLRTDASALRVWAPGCATGEEAYSLAILLGEATEKANVRCEVQVFGTDLDSRAIEAARLGVYPANIAADVSRERLDRCFSHENNAYRVHKRIREWLVFAPHDVIKDPPFTKLDLIVCRNLLIYFDAEAQRMLLPMFHYALRPDGLLFLGPSESIGGFTDLFATVDGKWKIYRRKDALSPVQPVLELSRGFSRAAAGEHERARTGLGVKASHTTSAIERLLLSRFAPTVLVVNGEGDLVYLHGRTGAYLEPSEGQPRNNVLEMARHGLARPLSAALRQAVRERREVFRPNLQVKTNGEFTVVDLRVAPLDGLEAVRGLFLVTLLPAAEPPAPVARPAKSKSAPPDHSEELEQELRYTKETLQTTIEELESSNEELKSTNEELQSTNEELQSANEELETSREEMQSLNEELTTVNSQLQVKVEELSRATDDMQNLLNNTDVAMIFLDDDLKVKRYTEPVRRLIKLIPGDIGRPLSDLASKVDYPKLIDDCRAVLHDLKRKEAEIHSHADTWHVMRIIPYRTAENVVDGVVLTFQEIEQPRREAERARELFESIVQAIGHPLVVLDAELRVEFANETFCRSFGTTRGAVERRPLFELAGPACDGAGLGERLRSVLRDGEPVRDFAAEGDFPAIGRKRLCLNARRLQRGPRGPTMILLVLEEVK